VTVVGIKGTSFGPLPKLSSLIRFRFSVPLPSTLHFKIIYQEASEAVNATI